MEQLKNYFINEARSITVSIDELLNTLKQYKDNRMFIEVPEERREMYGKDIMEVTAGYIRHLIQKNKFTSPYVKIGTNPFNYRNPKYEITLQIN